MALIQTKSGNGGNYSNTNVQTLTSSVTAGNKLILSIVAGAADTIGSISGNSNTYTLITNFAITSDRQVWLYYVEAANAGSTTVTVTYGAGQFPDSVVIIREYSGLVSSGSLDKTALSSNTSSYTTTHTTAASAATTQADELVIVAGGNSGNAPSGYSAGSGYGNLVTQNGFDLYTYGMMEDATVSSVGAQTGTYSTTQNVIGIVILATFKIASVGPSPIAATTQTLNTNTFFLS